MSDAVDDEDVDRIQAMVNSPKREPAPLRFDEDDNDDTPEDGGITLHMDGDDTPDDDDSNKMTPNTQRDQFGINSPRKHPSAPRTFDDDGDGGNPGNLITSVPQPTDNSDGSNPLQLMVTQVDPNEELDHQNDDNTQSKIQELNTAPQSGGLCACFSCLWSCCSSPQQNLEPVPMTNQTAMAQSGSDPKKSDPKENLLSATNSTANETESKPREDSVSSTEYSGNLLPPLKAESAGKKCLVLDLDETLVHSSFKPIPKPDFIIPVEIDRVVHHVYVLKRPYVDEFLLRASKHYEIVIFTASLSKYADPLLDKLDIHNVIEHRLFRESCVIHGTAYVKDMRRLSRKLKDTIIVDNSPPSYMFQPCNAVPIASWFDDQSDTQLLDFCPVIETTMKDIDDVRKLLDANNKSFRWLCNQAHQPLSKYTVRNDKITTQ